MAPETKGTYASCTSLGEIKPNTLLVETTNKVPGIFDKNTDEPITTLHH